MAATGICGNLAQLSACASVTVVAGLLQKAGLIEYTRGVIRVLDRPGLERQACECYEVMQREFKRLMQSS